MLHVIITASCYKRCQQIFLEDSLRWEYLEGLLKDQNRFSISPHNMDKWPHVFSELPTHSSFQPGCSDPVWATEGTGFLLTSILCVKGLTWYQWKQSPLICFFCCLTFCKWMFTYLKGLRAVAWIWGVHYLKSIGVNVEQCYPAASWSEKEVSLFTMEGFPCFPPPALERGTIVWNQCLFYQMCVF